MLSLNFEYQQHTDERLEMCLQARSYNARKHAIYLTQLTRHYATDLLNCYDDLLGNEWFTDKRYKELVEELMEVHKDTTRYCDYLKQIRECDITKQYKIRFIAYQEEINRTIDDIQRAYQNIKTEKFKYMCIFDLHRKQAFTHEQSSVLEKYNITFDELIKKLGIKQNPHMLAPYLMKDGTRIIVDQTANKVYDGDMWINTGEWKPIGDYDPETEEATINFRCEGKRVCRTYQL